MKFKNNPKQTRSVSTPYEQDCLAEKQLNFSQKPSPAMKRRNPKCLCLLRCCAKKRIAVVSHQAVS